MAGAASILEAASYIGVGGIGTSAGYIAAAVVTSRAGRRLADAEAVTAKAQAASEFADTASQYAKLNAQLLEENRNLCKAVRSLITAIESLLPFVTDAPKPTVVKVQEMIALARSLT